MRMAHDGVPSGKRSVHGGEQLVLRQRPLEVEADTRLEACDDRERCALIRPDRMKHAVDVRTKEAAVERDQLAVEPVERADAQVAALGQLGDAEIAVVGALEQRADRRCLEQRVPFPLRVQVGVAHGLHVQ